MGSNTSTSPSRSRSVSGPVSSRWPATTRSRSSGQAAVGSSVGSPSSPSCSSSAKRTPPSAQRSQHVLLQVMLAQRLRGLLVLEAALTGLRSPREPHPARAAAGVGPAEGVDAVVHAGRVALGVRGGERGLDRGHRLRVRLEERPELGHVGLPGVGVGHARAREREEVLGRAHDEDGDRHGHQVGGGAVREIGLHGQAAPVRAVVGTGGVAGGVGEASGHPHRSCPAGARRS